MRLRDHLVRLIRDEISNIWTAAVGKVIFVHDNPFTCDVELMIDTGGEPIQLYRLPILLTNYGESLIFSKPKVGDIVMILFTKYNFLDTFIKEIPSKISPRKFDVSNAFVLPGVYTIPKQDPELEQLTSGDILIKHKNGNYIKINEDIEVKHNNGNYIRINNNILIKHKNGSEIRMNEDIELNHCDGNYVKVTADDVILENTSGAAIKALANGDVELVSTT